MNFFLYELLPTILNMSIIASIVIVAVLAIRLLLKRAPKIFSYAIWAVVLFRLLCPLTFESAIGLLPSNDPIPVDIVHVEYPQVDLPIPMISEGANELLPQGEVQVVADPLEAPMSIATLMWAVGVLAMLIYSVVQYLLLKRKLIGAKPHRENIYLADGINSPFVMGLFKPKIYLPSSLPKSEYDFIIAHEKCHIKRLDHITRVLSFIALALHWFNPLVWVAYIASAKDMEMSCDEAVMKNMESDIRAEYSTSLLRLTTGKKLIFATPLAFGEGDTKGRVKNVMKYKKPTVWVSVLCLVLLGVAALSLMSNEKEESVASSISFGDDNEFEFTIYEANTSAGVGNTTLSKGDEVRISIWSENEAELQVGIIPTDRYDNINLDEFVGEAVVLTKEPQEIVVEVPEDGMYRVSFINSTNKKVSASGKVEYETNGKPVGLSNDGLPLPFVTIQADDKLHEPRYYENGFKFTYDELPIITLAKESAELPINYSDEFEDVAYWSIDTYYDDGRVMRESFDVEIGSNEINRLNITDGQKGYIPNLDFNANYAICWVKADENKEAEYVFKVEFDSLANGPLLWDLPPMVMVNSKIYIDTGEMPEDTIFENPLNSNFDGTIASTVNGNERPTQNDQSNFGEDFGYRIIDAESIAIYINEEWYVFELAEKEPLELFHDLSADGEIELSIDEIQSYSFKTNSEKISVTLNSSEEMQITVMIYDAKNQNSPIAQYDLIGGETNIHTNVTSATNYIIRTTSTDNDATITVSD